MKNKGFTLIELIVTIGILVAIGLVISTNILGLFSQSEDNEYEEFVNRLNEAACMYVETSWDSTKRASCKTSNNCSVTINELISKGYIDDDEKNPSTGEIVSGSVQVKWVNNEKTCTWSE
jgi:prepilin-type N-terminal cleavage/methylation domain-containing protein